MVEINYNKIDERVRNTVKTIEAKPHVHFIRYLLSKRYSPTLIKQELFKLALSAPHEPNLIVYYMAVMDPIIKSYGLGWLYADYKSKLLRKNSRNDYARDILNYKLHLEDNPDAQVKFCKFVKDTGIEDLWIGEIYRFHGATENMPIDENGQRVLNVSSPNKTVEKILIHPKRYLVDKLILENIPDRRIADYCRENLKLGVYEYDILFYKKAFFNIRTHAIEDKIKVLEVERNSLKTLMGDLESLDVYKSMEIGEKSVIRRQTDQRIEEIDDNIKTLNMMFSEFAFKSAVTEQQDFEQIFADIMARSYRRFCDLDNYKDRDVVDPMMKVARIMTAAHDKIETIKEIGGSSKGVSDKHSQSVLMEIYKKRSDQIMEEQIDRANKALAEAGIEPIAQELIPEDIGGIDELGISFDVSEEET
jgi:hypothetical protein